MSTVKQEGQASAPGKPCQDNGRARPLDGLRVVDMTSVVMGPSCTQALGDMGAEVLKVESLDGDTTRVSGQARHAGMGPLYLNANRSKKSIAINLKARKGLAALLRLIERADVLVYNVRPQAMERLGLSWDAVRQVNPRLIYAGLFGYGQDGAYAALPAYDDLIQAASGMAMLFHQSTGEEPRYVPSAIADRIAGLSAMGAILAAVIERQRSGLGQRVDVPMFETMTAFVMADHMAGQTFVPPLPERGYARQLSPQRKPYRTQDGYISVLVYSDKQWRSFLQLIGRGQDFEQDPRYRDVGSRLAHVDALYGEVERVLATQTTEAWLRDLRAADIPAMPVHDLGSIFQDPHLVGTGFFSSRTHPSEGEIVEMRCASTWSRTQARATHHAPRLGEHSVEVLRDAGFAPAEIQALLDEKTLFDPAV